MTRDQIIEIFRDQVRPSTRQVYFSVLGDSMLSVAVYDLDRLEDMLADMHLVRMVERPGGNIPLIEPIHLLIP